jgi:hypothetical protein
MVLKIHDIYQPAGRRLTFISLSNYAHEPGIAHRFLPNGSTTGFVVVVVGKASFTNRAAPKARDRVSLREPARGFVVNFLMFAAQKPGFVPWQTVT